MKKKLRLTVVAELEIDTEWYGEPGDIDEHIIAVEFDNWAEWITGHVTSEDIEITSPDGNTTKRTRVQK